MRLMTVAKDMGAGGAERLLAGFLPEFKARGLDVTLVCLMDDMALAGPVEEAGVEIIRLGHGLPVFQPGKVMRSATALRSLIRDRAPDVVHTHLYLPDLVAYMSAPGGTRLLTTVHNVYPWWNWRDAVGKRFRYLAMTRIESILFRVRDARFTAVSNAVREGVLKNLFVRPERIRTLYNCIRPEEFEPKDSYEPADSPTIIQVANLHRSKGHMTSLKAFRLVRKLHPTARLLMAGEGRMRPVLEKAIDDLGLSGSALLLGRRDDVKELLREADICWMPSLYEGLSIASLEAMATGLPMVVTNASGLNETVVDGETGFIVNIGDHEMLANRTIKLLSDPVLAESMGKSGRRRVEAVFSLDRAVDEYVKCYGDLVAGTW